MKFLKLSADDCRPPSGLIYADVNNLHPLFDKLQWASNLLMVGPQGIGKSLAIQSWAVNAGEVPTLTFDCSEDVRRGQLYGHYIMQGEDSPFVLGALTNAIEIANEAGCCILVLEEINALTPQLQKALSPLDFRKQVALPEVQRVFRLEGSARLWVIGTMNDTVYGGVNELNPDLKSRFRMVPLGYPAEEEERRIVDSLLPKWSVPAIKVGSKQLDIRDGVIRLAKETRTHTFEYQLSPRDVVAILEDVQLAGLHDALWLSTGKFEEADRATYVERVKSVFGPKALGPRGV